MSGWRIAAKELYVRPGHCGTRAQIASEPSALAALKVKGMANCDGLHSVAAVWTLTQRGIDWCENRVAIIGGVAGSDKRIVQQLQSRGKKLPPHLVCGHGTRFVATWIGVLPRPGCVK